MKKAVAAIPVAALLALAACNLPQPQPDTVRHFTLADGVVAAPVAGATQVLPVQVAGHLRRRELAVRVADHEVEYVEDARWAEALDASITQMLRNRLGTVDGGATVVVEVQRCELNRADGNRVELSATYVIRPAGGDPALARRGAFTATPRTWDGKDYRKLVDLLHDAVAELGEAIAAAVAEKK